jgi:hypothetical protein
MDDIEKFILTNFSKLDKKIKQKEKEKKEKLPIKKLEDSKLILNNQIDDTIYTSITTSKNVEVN